MRRKLTWLAVVGGASFYVLAFFAGDGTWLARTLRLDEIETGLSRSINVVFTMAIGLGIINLAAVHGGNLARRRKDWPYSLVVCVSFLLVLAALLWQYRISATERALEAEAGPTVRAYETACRMSDSAERERALASFSADEAELVARYYEYRATYQFQPRRFYLETFYGPLAATVMALLGFYITYAAYRAFRIRTLEATVMMLSAAVVIIGSDPLGNWISVQLNQLWGGMPWLHLPALADFDNRVMSSGMQRGLWIGISVAIVAVSARILLGLEKGLLEARRGGE